MTKVLLMMTLVCAIAVDASAAFTTSGADDSIRSSVQEPYWMPDITWGDTISQLVIYNDVRIPPNILDEVYEKQEYWTPLCIAAFYDGAEWSMIPYDFFDTAMYISDRYIVHSRFPGAGGQEDAIEIMRILPSDCGYAIDRHVLNGVIESTGFSDVKSCQVLSVQDVHWDSLKTEESSHYWLVSLWDVCLKETNLVLLAEDTAANSVQVLEQVSLPDRVCSVYASDSHLILVEHDAAPGYKLSKVEAYQLSQNSIAANLLSHNRVSFQFSTNQSDNYTGIVGGALYGITDENILEFNYAQNLLTTWSIKNGEKTSEEAVQYANIDGCLAFMAPAR